MLIVPLSGKISWRNPPWITIGIILINSFVFFLFQTGEDERYREAMSFYFESDLARMEISAYLAYLEADKGDRNMAALRNQENMEPQALFQFYRNMQRDRDFLHKLHNDEIIRPRHEEYGPWKQLKSTYEEMLSRVIGYKYGFIPARMTPLTAFTHMFLHGGLMHLLGNMVFLWLVGCVLETGWGRAAYAGTYVTTGLLALGRACMEKGMGEKGRRCLQALCKRFPVSPESRIAQGLLKASAKRGKHYEADLI
jgi:hypothetical protein